MMGFGEAEIENKITEQLFSLTHKRISSPGEELIDSGILTSITIAELAVELEKTFSISLSFIEVNKENFCSVAAIKELVLKKLV